MEKSKLTFKAIGQFGVEVAQEGGFAFFKIPTDLKAGRPSASGKMSLTGSTGGWVNLPDSDLRVNVMAGGKA